MKRNAFTLIELLVVIAIIAVLAAIAIPVYSAAMEKARVTQDGSNLRQIGIGIQAYLNDHNDDMFPVTGADPWARVMHENYVKDWKAYHSPFDRVPASRLIDPGSGAIAPVSYGVNTELFGVTTSKFGSASELIMMAPDMTSSTPATFAGTSGTENKLKVGGLGGARNGTHQSRSRINALFADAHVANMLFADFVKDTGDQRGRWHPETP